MKRFIVIGLGNFGSTVAKHLFSQGHDVVAVDTREENVDRIANYVTRAAVGDGRSMSVLEKLGVSESDAGVVSTGDDITSSILATMTLKDLKVAEIYVKVISGEHGRVMERLGVDEIIFPEQESGRNLADRLNSRGLLNYVKIARDFSLQEMVVPDGWNGKTLRELNLPKEQGLSIIAVHDMLLDKMTLPPDPDMKLKDSDTLIVAGRSADLRKLNQ